MDPKRRAIPSFSPAFIHTPPNGVLHTESTANLDTEEGLSSGRIDGDAQGLMDPPDRPIFSNQAFPRRPHYGSLPENTFLRTQPVKKLTSPIQVHSHTKSYDVNGVESIQYQAPYMHKFLHHSL